MSSSVLYNYKKQCILSRLNFISIEISDHLTHGDFRDSEPVSPCRVYGLGNSKFESDTETDLRPEWHRCYLFADAWNGWDYRSTRYARNINYRKSLIRAYEKDFNDVIQTVNTELND